MIAIDNIITHVLQEDEVFNAQLVAEVYPSEAALVTIISGNDNNYLHIDQATGRITLTAAGVIAIEQDFPDDLENEISEISITVQVESLADQSTAEEDILIGIIRVHDEAPQIVEEIITPLYSEDASVGLRVLEIRAAYESTFTVLTGASYVTVVTPEVGRATLTSAGAQYIFDNPGAVLDFSVLIHDTLNSKEYTQVYSLDILLGSSENNIPTKNILDLVGEHLGADLGEMLSKINIELFKMSAERDLIVRDLDIAFESSVKSEAGVEKLILDIKETQAHIDNKIKTVTDIIDHLISSVKDQFSESLFIEISAYLNKYREQEQIFMEDVVALQAMEMGQAIKIESNKEYLTRYLQKEDGHYADLAQAKNDALQILLQNNIDAVALALSNYILANDLRSLAIETDIADNVKTAITTNTTNITSNDGEILAHNGRIATLETQVATNTGKTLESFDNLSGWDFDSTTLRYSNNIVIDVSGNLLTLVNPGPGGGRMYVQNGKFGNSTLVCEGSLFTGTATKAKYADVAEYYKVQAEIPAGTLAEFSQAGDAFEMRIATGASEVIGTITTQPGTILNDPEGKDGEWSAVALTGRTPMLVVNADVAQRGDYIYQDDTDFSRGFCQSTKRSTEAFIGRVINLIDDDNVEAKVNT